MERNIFFISSFDIDQLMYQSFLRARYIKSNPNIDVEDFMSEKKPTKNITDQDNKPAIRTFSAKDLGWPEAHEVANLDETAQLRLLGKEKKKLETHVSNGGDLEGWTTEGYVYTKLRYFANYLDCLELFSKEEYEHQQECENLFWQLKDFYDKGDKGTKGRF